MADSVTSKYASLIPYDELVSKLDIHDKMEKLVHDSKRLHDQADALQCQFDELKIAFKDLEKSIQD